jgi:hypothetical protein
MKHQGDSQLFLVRLWPEQGSDGETEWHGKLQHVLSGEARPFHGCPALLEALLEMLKEDQGSGVGGRGYEHQRGAVGPDP